MTQLLPYVTAALALVSCGIALFVAIRQGAWRNTDDAKALYGRVGALESRASLLESKLGELPTKSDVTAISEKVGALQNAMDKTERGVERIESFLMERGK